MGVRNKKLLRTPFALFHVEGLLVLGRLLPLEKRLHEVDGDREQDGVRFLRGNRGHGLQISELERGRLAGHELRSLRQLRRCLELTLGMHHLGSPVPLGLGLGRH